MTDRDPYGRRRTPDDRDYQSQNWEEEVAESDPYDYQPPRDRRRPADQPGRQQGGSNDPFLPATDPYASNAYRQPNPPYASSERGEWEEQPAWPERPYASTPRSSPQTPLSDPYAAPLPPTPRQSGYDYDPYSQQDDVAVWEEEQRRGSRRPPRPASPPYEEDYRRRPNLAVPAGVSSAISGVDSRLLLIMIGAVLSLFAMIAVVAVRADTVGSFPLHINAAGETTKWGSEGALWRLPFSVTMVTLMNLIAGFALGLRDRKMTWLMIVSLPVLHLLGWIALFLIAW